ncbi:MAG: hypothetical protein AOA66_0317 [Candidatus Bathyarchaeota archaeon BA2]|nr:MAG: hypothetical protein AOA66_0317 [Candidatus Bathyarchaeota archaeon BA2]
MEMKINERVGLYFEIFNELYQRVSKANSERAVEVALGMLGEIAKDLRAEQIARWRMKEREESSRDPATEKQKEALHRVWSEENSRGFI